MGGGGEGRNDPFGGRNTATMNYTSLLSDKMHLCLNSKQCVDVIVMQPFEIQLKYFV